MATSNSGSGAWPAILLLVTLLLLPKLSFCEVNPLDCSDDEDNDGLPQTSGTLVCSSQDRQALLLFKASISSDPNKALSDWSKSSNCCSWNGVTCDGATGRVVRLKLRNQGLKGKLASGLGALSALQVLILDNNLFSGSIPSTYGNFAHLQRLCISSNPSLSGAIPATFGQGLTSVLLMDLRSNALSGPLPSNFGNMSTLKELGLYGNKISGAIPRSFGQLSNLRSAGLGSNQLSGMIPNEFGRGLSSLRYLILGNNRITGLPADLRKLTSLQWIDLSNNPLRNADAVAGIATMPLISQIELDSCNISGPFPSWVSRLPNPDSNLINYDEVTPSLVLSNNAITGPIPAAVGNLRNLEYLRLENNKLTGSIPASLANLQSLRGFNVSYNELSGQIPQVSPFPTFPTSSYTFPTSSYRPGNPGLCGTPLSACKTTSK